MGTYFRGDRNDCIRGFTIEMLQKFPKLPTKDRIFQSKGGFPVMAEITRILAANIRRQFFFVIYHHCSEYSLLSSKFSTNLLFAASKCHVTIQ